MNFAHAEVATLDPTTMRTLCEEYIANNYIDPETSERLGVKRGLRNPDGTGVLAGLTNVCDVVGYKKDHRFYHIAVDDAVAAGIHDLPCGGIGHHDAGHARVAAPLPQRQQP